MSRRIIPTALAVIMIVAMVLPLSAAAAPTAQGPEVTPAGVFRGVSTAVKFDVSPPLRDIVPLVAPETKPFEIPELATGLEGAFGPQDADAALQTTYGPSLIPGPIVSFNGPGNISQVSPPDPVGDVGPNHYVAMSNLSFQIFNKTGTSLYGPALNNTLWAGFGGDCQTDNSGDPIVVHDQISDRWMLSQFTASGPTYFNCVAVSTTPDPTGSYYRWAFSTGVNFPDYPKYGWWPDGLYISTREFANGATFAGMGAYAIKRADLISGNPAAQVISFLATAASAGGAYNIGDGLLPSDLDGSTLPPAGTPNFFMGSMDNGGPYGAPQDALTLWKFTADFTTPANSSFVLANTIPIAAYDTIFPCSPTSRNCIPQPGTTNKIDILSYRQRPMHRLAYRNFGTHQSLVTNQSVEAATGMAGIRWWEIRSPNSTPVLYQDSTYAPGIQDTIHRWMGSIAMDSAGNMALGYSASNGTTTYPSSWYTGRLSSDPLNSMPQGEGAIINGTGSQTGSGRWGDYTSMNVDPVDDCTFWYVNQWVPTTSSVGWQLRIGSFKFNECGSADFTLAVAPTSQEICVGTVASYNVTVGSVSGYNSPVTLSASGNPGTASFGTNPVTPPGSSAMTISGAAAGTYNFNVVGTAAGPNVKQAPVGLTVQAAAPASPVLTAPANGATNVSATPTFTWNAVAGATSYSIQVATDMAFTNVVASASGLANTTWTSNVTLATGTMYYWRVWAVNACGVGSYSSVFSFTTLLAPGACSPGTTQVTVLSQSFDGSFPPAGWVVANTTTNCAAPGVPDWTNTDPGARGNLTGGVGLFAIADSDACGSTSVMNAQMWTPAMNLAGLTNPTVSYYTDYDDLSTTSDVADLDFSIDGGTTWANLISWNADHRGPLQVIQTFAADNQANTRLRWNYTNATWDWWWQVDEVVVTACQPAAVDPNIDVSPLSMSATQATNTTTQQTLTVANTGGGTLTWTIAEEPADLPQMVQPSGYAPRDPAVDAAAGAVGTAPESPVGVATWQRPEVVLYDNGPLVNSPGTGPGGADESLARDTTVGLTSRGFNHSLAGAFRVADDFTITDPGGWNITSVTFFPYMGNAPTAPSPITAVNFQIWDGPPDQPTSSVVFGDTTTNRLSSTAFGNIYRRWESQPTDATRPVFGTVATAGTTLPAGTYWIDWQVDGDINYTGPWAPPVTIDGQTSTGNALQSVSGAWQPVVDTGLQTTLGLPFIVEGTVVPDVACDNPANVGWLSVSPANGSNAGGTNTPVTVTFDSTGLATGTYNANLCVDSNDPNPGPGNGTDLVVVPVTLTVQPPTAVTLSGLASSASPSAIPASLPMAAAAVPAAAGLAMAAVYALRRKR